MPLTNNYVEIQGLLEAVNHYCAKDIFNGIIYKVSIWPVKRPNESCVAQGFVPGPTRV